MSQPETRPTILPKPGTVRLRGVGKTYPLEGKPLPVLADVDLDIAGGQFVSIVGPSGCGKSTLLRLVLGIDPAFDGEILVDGTAVTGPGLDRGIVFQDHRLLPWKTLHENVGLALINRRISRREKHERVDAHLALVGLEGFAGAYPHQLSGGMAQRAAIARALVNEPRVLLLDEPFGALDALTRIRLQRELQRIWLRSRSTMIMVTHDVDEAVSLGDVVVVMDGKPGRISHTVQVDLPHPRVRTAPAVQHLKEEILGTLIGSDGEPPPAERGATDELTLLAPQVVPLSLSGPRQAARG